MRPTTQSVVVDLEKYMQARVRVCVGQRVCVGVLKGFDPLLNVVLDDAVEVVTLPDGSEVNRPLGLLVCRGPNVSLISPFVGMKQIENPFAEAEEDAADADA